MATISAASVHRKIRMPHLYNFARTEGWRRVLAALDNSAQNQTAVKDANLDKVELERQIAKSKMAVEIVERLLTVFGPAMKEDGEINGGDAVDTLIEILTPAVSSFADVSKGPQEVLRGRFAYEGMELVVDFQAPVDATVAEKDAAFMAALAQKADIDFLSIGVLNESLAVEDRQATNSTA